MKTRRELDALIERHIEKRCRQKSVYDKDMSQAEYERLRAAQMRKRHGTGNKRKRVVPARLKNFHSKVSAFKKKNADFMDTIDSANDIFIPTGLADALIDSDHGPYVMYMLCKNKKHLLRLCRLPLMEMHLEILNIELSR